MVALRPGKCAGQALRASFQVANGDTAQALKELRELSSGADRAECHRVRAELAIAASMPDEATAAISALAEEPCESDPTCTTNLVAAAALEDSRGRPSVALTYLKAGRNRRPDDEALAVRFAQRSAQLGMHGEAAQTYDALLRHHPDHTGYKALADAERARMMQP